MTTTPLVSVVIPAFNRATTLPRAVDSVLTQNYRCLEVIVIDDGSTDDTLRVARGLATADSRVRVLTLPANLGAQAARNRGIDAAQGEFIAFLDSDDEWLPGKTARQLAVFGSAPTDVGVVYGGYVAAYEDGRPREVVMPALRGRVYRQLLASYGLPILTLLVRRDILDSAGPLDESIAAWQEWDLCIRLARLCAFDYVNEPLATYHLHGGDTISRNLARGARGYEQVVDRHAWAIRAEHDRSVLATHYVRAARQYHDARDRRHAALAALRGLRTRPWDVPAWKELARAAFPRPDREPPPPSSHR